MTTHQHQPSWKPKGLFILVAKRGSKAFSCDSNGNLHWHCYCCFVTLHLRNAAGNLVDLVLGNEGLVLDTCVGHVILRSNPSTMIWLFITIQSIKHKMFVCTQEGMHHAFFVHELWFDSFKAGTTLKAQGLWIQLCLCHKIPAWTFAVQKVQQIAKVNKPSIIPHKFI